MQPSPALDETRLRFEDKFGKNIKWFENFGTLNFEAKDYLETIESFRQQLVTDKKRYESQRHSVE